MFRSFKESTRVRSPGATGHRGFLQNSAGSVAQICTSIIDIAHIWQANRKLCRSRSAVVQCIAFCISVVLEANIQLLTCKKLNKSFQKKKKKFTCWVTVYSFQMTCESPVQFIVHVSQSKEEWRKKKCGGDKRKSPHAAFLKNETSAFGEQKKKKKIETVSSVMISFWCEFRSFH